MQTLNEFTIQNGMVTESYSVLRDEAGDIFLLNIMDAEEGGPSDIMHIDRKALRRVALALWQAAGAVPEIAATDDSVVVQFPAAQVVKIVPGAPVDVVPAFVMAAE